MNFLGLMPDNSPNIGKLVLGRAAVVGRQALRERNRHELIQRPRLRSYANWRQPFVGQIASRAVILLADGSDRGTVTRGVG